MTAPDPSTALDEQLERLLAGVVERPTPEQEAALTDLCREEPTLAAALRARFEQYQRLLRAMPAPRPNPTKGRFGEFELLRELGRGGMGVVYLARQQRAGQERLVAVKLVRDRGLLSEQARERMRREAAAAFRLDDPGLCPVFDVGETDGVPWLAMRYVPGRTLAEHIADVRAGEPLVLPTHLAARGEDTESTSGAQISTGTARHAALLAIGESLARSLHVAHEAGFVHRDVKPGNVMITPDGMPVLLDFGLVRDDSHEHTLTATGETLGTPAYMAPEQIDGTARVDRTADVYSLAATLWEAIALERPFAGQTREELFASILHGELRDLRRLAPGVSRDLQIVLATAMAREPDRRYATALEFALELRRVRRNEPILARPPGPLRRSLLWSQRNRLAASLLAGLLASLLVVLLVAVDARQSARAAQRAEHRAVANLGAARRAVSELIHVQNEELDDVPGLEGVRRDMQERALALLREFRAVSSEDPGLLRDNARALVVGAVLELSLGRPEQATTLADEARSVLAMLGSHPFAQGVWGQVHLFDGEMHRRRGDLDAAISDYEAAIAALQHDAADAENVVRTMRALCEYGELQERRNDRAAARAAIDRAVRLAQDTCERHHPRVVVGWADALLQRARLHREDNDTAAADADMQAAEQALRDLLAAGSQTRQAMAKLADCLTSHATVFRLLGKDKERREALVEAQQLLERMTVSFPQMPGYRHSLALVLSNRASLLAADGDPDGAITVLEGARQQLLGLVAEYPDVTRYRYTLAGLLFNLGNRVRRDHDTAIRHYVDACTHLDRLLAQQPDDAGMNELASRVALNLGITYAIDRRPVAADTFARARRHAEEVLRLRPGDRRSRQLRGLLLFNEGVFRAENDDLEAAGPLLAQAFEQGTEVLAATPDNGNRAAELLKWGVRYAQVTELASPADGDTAWRRVTAAWRAMPERIKAELRAKSASDLDVCMLRRRQVAAEAHAGDGDARAQLEQIERQLTAIVAEPNPGAATYAELVLCRFDLAAAAAAAGEASRATNHRAAAERQLAAWPADLKPDQITRARLRARAADDPTARAAFARFLDAL